MLMEGVSLALIKSYLRSYCCECEVIVSARRKLYFVTKSYRNDTILPTYGFCNTLIKHCKKRHNSIQFLPQLNVAKKHYKNFLPKCTT